MVRKVQAANAMNVVSSPKRVSAQGRQLAANANVQVGSVGMSVVGYPVEDMGMQKAIPLAPVSRLRDLQDGPVPGIMPEPDHTYCLGSNADGMEEIASQLELLRSEIRGLTDKLRPLMPDCLYEDKDGYGEASEGYYAAGNLNSPLLKAMAEVANDLRYARHAVSHIQSNVVV